MQGQPRTSNIVTLVASRCTENTPPEEQRVEMILNSYSSFAAKNEVSLFFLC